MQAYKNDATLKDRFIAEIEKHRKADQVIQGTYGDNDRGQWRGCAVACSLRSLDIIDGQELKGSYSNHADYETKLGIPEWLAHLEDTIFEGLPVDQAVLWPERFAQAIPVGADLDPIKWKFCAFILKENIERVLTLDIAEDLKKQVVDAVRGVLAVHEKAIETGIWDESAAESARSAARSAWSAAWLAAESAAWLAAESAAWSAAWLAAESAAWSAAWSARSAAYTHYADELIRLIEAA